MLGIMRAQRNAGQRFLPALAHRDYRVMWFGHIFGESASWAMGAAEGWLIFNLADSNPSTWVGAIFLVAMLPWFVVPIIAGYLTDRFIRRNILLFAYVVSLLHSLTLALLVLTGVVQPWHILALAFVNGCARAVHMGAIESLSANLVPRQVLPNAYILVNAGYYATRLIGPGVIAPIIDVVGLEWIFFTCTAFYGVGIFFVLRIHTRSTGIIDPDKGLLDNAFSGFKYVYGHKVLRSIILIVLFH